MPLMLSVPLGRARRLRLPKIASAVFLCERLAGTGVSCWARQRCAAFQVASLIRRRG
jgi:hypothetical protein